MNWLRRWSTRLYDGSVVIGWRVARWPWAAPDTAARMGRCIAVFLLGSAAWRVPWLFCLSWCFAAWRAGPRKAHQDTDEALEDEDSPVAPPRVAPPEETRAWIIPKIRALIGDSNGVHLDALLGRLIDEGHLSSATRVTSFRRDLEANGIPVRDSVNIGNVTRVGIHRDDLLAVAGGGAAPDVLTPPPLDRHGPI